MRSTYRLPVTNLATGSVDNVGTTFHLSKHFGIEEIFSLRVERAVNRDNITDLLKIIMIIKLRDDILQTMLNCELS